MSNVSAITGIATVTLRDKRAIEVKELRWKDYIWAIKELTGNILGLVGEGKDVSSINKEKIIEVVSEQEQLVAVLIKKSTSLSEAEISELFARDVLLILEAMVQLNFSEEVVGTAKKLGTRMGEVFSKKTS